ncbi:MAG: hypothetical protein AB7P02_06540 [Alphaproteobacteria bacterium]
MARWVEVPIYSPVYQNVAETALRNGNARLENGFITEAKTHSRFPGLKEWLRPPSPGRDYLFEHRGDMICVTSFGLVYRIGSNRTVTNVTGVPVSGGRRVIAAKTQDDMLFAAGGPIVRLVGPKTDLLSKDAPLASHVGYVDGYVLANEIGSGRFQYAPAPYTTWDPLNVFTAEAKDDPITSLIVTAFNEVILGGPASIEQWERNPDGTAPFFRRWTAGDGSYAPYTLAFAENALYGVTSLREFSRISGQLAQPVSVPMQARLEKIDDWSDAFSLVANFRGNRFIILQLPNATTVYDTKGVTLLFDYRQQRWSSLYGWDEVKSQPGRWPGWSIVSVWGRDFVGGDGVIYEVDDETYAQDGGITQMLGRTGHFDMRGSKRIDDMRIRLERGRAPSDATTIQLRVNRDNRGFTSWLSRPLGIAGDRTMLVHTGPLGMGRTFQFEYRVSAAMPIEIVSMEILVTDLGH